MKVHHSPILITAIASFTLPLTGPAAEAALDGSWKSPKIKIMK